MGAQIVNVLIEFCDLRISFCDTAFESTESLQGHPAVPFTNHFACILVQQEILGNFRSCDIHTMVMSFTGTVPKCVQSFGSTLVVA